LTELHSNVDCHFSTARIFKAAPVPCRGRLRLSTSSLLDICPSQCVTLGDQWFATAGPRLWNSLPADVRSASSLITFCQKLKTYLFRQS